MFQRYLLFTLRLFFIPILSLLFITPCLSQSPGGVDYNDLILWLRADNPGSNTFNSGDRISSWEDLSQFGLDFTQSVNSQTPYWINNALTNLPNFWPFINLSPGLQFDLPTGLSATLNNKRLSLFAVFYHTGTFDSSYSPLYEIERDAFPYSLTNIFGFNHFNSQQRDVDVLKVDSRSNITDALTSFPEREWVIVNMASSDLEDNTIFFDFINSHQTAELIAYNRELNQNETQRVNAYLAMKYGIHYNAPYLASSGNTIGAQSGVHKFFLGRDDDSDLKVVVSQSESSDLLKVGIIALSTSNFDNPITISEDRSSLVFTENGDELRFSTDNTPAQFEDSDMYCLQTLEKIWRVEKRVNGVTSDKNISSGSHFFAFKSPYFNNYPIADLQLIIDTDGDGLFNTGVQTFVTPLSLNNDTLLFRVDAIDSDANGIDAFTISNRRTRPATFSEPVIMAGQQIVICENLPLDLEITSPMTHYVFTWYLNTINASNTLVSTPDYVDAFNYSIVPTSTGRFIVAYEDRSGCYNGSKEFNVVLRTITYAPNIRVEYPPYACTQSAVNLITDYPVDRGVNIRWYLNGAIVGSNNIIRLTNLPIVSNQYSASYYDDFGCVSESEVKQFNLYPYLAQPVVTATTDRICVGDTLTLTALTNETNITWLRNTYEMPAYQNMKSIMISRGGNYQVRVENSVGCTAESPDFNTIVAPYPINPTISNSKLPTSNNIVVCDQEQVELFSSLSGPNVEFQWYLNGSPISGETGEIYQGTLQRGTYTLEVSNFGICSAFSDNAVNVITDMFGGNYAFDRSLYFVSNQPVTLTINANTAVPSPTYTWYYNGNELTEYVGRTAISVTQTGDYRVRVINSNNGCPGFYNTRVENLPQSVTLVVEKTDLCDGETLELNVQTTIADSYVWYKDGTVFSTTTTSSININQAGTYYVSLMFAGSPVTVDSSPVTIQRVSPPNPPAILGDKPIICSKNEEATLQVTTNHSIVAWYYNGTPIDDSSVKEIKVSEVGRYHVEIQNSAGCRNVSSNFILNLLQASDDICFNYDVSRIFIENMPITLNISCIALSSNINSPNFYNFIFYFLNNRLIFNATNFTSISVSEEGTYYASLVNSNGCTVSTDPIFIDKAIIGEPSINISSDIQNLCDENQQFIITTSNGADSYQWYRNGEAITGLVQQNKYTSNQTGTYHAVVRVGVHTSQTFPITIGQKRFATDIDITPSDDFFIQNDSSVELAVSATNLSSLTWSLAGQELSNNNQITIDQAGIYRIDLYSDDDCVSTRYVTVTQEEPIPDPVIITDKIPILRSGTTLELDVFLDYYRSGYIYTWKLNGETLVSSRNRQLTIDTPGIYEVEVSNGLSTKISQGYKVDFFTELPVIFREVVTNYCILNTAILTCSIEDASTYTWYRNGALLTVTNSRVLSVEESGSYKVSTGYFSNTIESDLSREVEVIVLANNYEIRSISGLTSIAYGDSETFFIASNSPLYDLDGISFVWKYTLDKIDYVEYADEVTVELTSDTIFNILITIPNLSCSYTLTQRIEVLPASPIQPIDIITKEHPKFIIQGIENFPLNSVFFYDATGRFITEIENYNNKDICWFGKDNDGELLSTGIYIYSIVIKSGTLNGLSVGGVISIIRSQAEPGN